MRADHVRLSQVLGNLLSNAAKYTPAGGTIELNVRVEPNNSREGAPGLIVIDGLDDILLVALTGYASESDKSRALAAGFDFHLTKPLSLDKLQYILANRADGKLRGIV